MPNGVAHEIELIRRVSRFWAIIWQLGNLLLYGGIFALFIGPVSSAGFVFEGDTTWDAIVKRLGLVLVFSLTIYIVSIVAGTLLQRLSRWRTRVAPQ